MSASEFIIVAAIVIVGLIFLVVGQRFIFGSQEETIQYGNQAEAEGIISLINRIVTEPASHVSYFQYISLSNITIKDGILTYEREGSKYSFQVPKNVSDVHLEETTSICVIKTDEKIMVSEECPKCNIDSVCSLDECKEICPDCVGPKKICIGDGFCNLNIGESCENSGDCKCGSGNCCPRAPDADETGCSKIEIGKLKKGEECWCSNQCESGLKCNPTTEDFKDYKNACCEPEKLWDGKDCIVPKKYHILYVPIGYSPEEFESFKSFAQQAFNHWLKASPFKECSDKENRIEALFVDPKDCQYKSCSNTCTDCQSIVRKCALNSPYKNSWDIIVGICKGTSCGGQCRGCAGGIPADTSVSNTADCGAAGYKISAHEMGHEFGLYHLDGQLPGNYGCWQAQGTCMGPNAADCNLPLAEKSQCLMPYCPALDHYCPAAYAFLKNIVFKEYLEGCG